MHESWKLLVFGASGAIGRSVTRHACARGWTVVGATRGETPADGSDGLTWRRYDPLTDDADQALRGEARFDAVCWAQGANIADSLLAFDVERHLALYKANCLSVMLSLSSLLKNDLLRPGGARLAVMSSVWQERARQDKLSYIVTKAAIGGLVRSASVDLGTRGHLINGVLPGVLDTPMTAANLSAAQIAAVSCKSSVGRLPDLATLSETVLFLCSRANNAVTGQSIAVDLGMSNAILI